MIKIKIGMITIPIMNINLYNSVYATDSLHTFSACCSKAVKHKKVCSGCGKELKGNEILKGLDETTILTETQEEKLKECLENGYIDVLAVKELENLTDFMPFVVKSQVILPSISKGFRKTDIKVFYGFKSALEQGNRYCIAKLVQRSKEHLVILSVCKGDLMMFELPFNKQNNKDEIDRLKQAVANETNGINLTEFTNEAVKFVNSYSNNLSLEQVKQEKVALLQKFISQIQSGQSGEKEEIEVKERNPFS